MPQDTPARLLTRALRTALPLALSTACALSLAQTAPAAQADEASGRPSPKVEHIVVEDGGSRVEETRVGGVTRQIEVQTKSGLPAYQIQPSQVQGPATSASERTGQPGGAGRSSWRVLSF
jgi:hypothetical protein